MLGLENEGRSPATWLYISSPNNHQKQNEDMLTEQRQASRFGRQEAHGGDIRDPDPKGEWQQKQGKYEKEKGENLPNFLSDGLLRVGWGTTMGLTGCLCMYLS